MPLSLKKAIHDRLNKAKLERLLRTKEHFRNQRQAGLAREQNPNFGVNLVAYIRAEMGLGVAARGMAAAFQAGGIPFNVINLEQGNYSSHTNYSWSHKEVRDSRYDITVVCVNPDNSFHLRTQVSPKILGDCYVIGNWYWELPQIPDAWLSEFEFTDEVWAASHFIRDAVATKTAAPVVYIPPVVQLRPAKAYSRADLGLPERRFLFLAMFDASSVLERKNPLGVLRAFKKAFADDDASVGLILKFNNTRMNQSFLRDIQGQLAENVFVVDRPMSQDEVSSLIESTDCFVSLHRSEGFGLGPAEAMSVGKPAIMTNWSGNTDYMTSDNCIAIDYELVELEKDYGPYQKGQYWAEPDLDQAAHFMKKVVSEPQLRERLGYHAERTIKSRFSPEEVGQIIQQRLQQIRDTR